VRQILPFPSLPFPSLHKHDRFSLQKYIEIAAAFFPRRWYCILLFAGGRRGSIRLGCIYAGPNSATSSRRRTPRISLSLL
jgi:hypothetical protein